VYACDNDRTGSLTRCGYRMIMLGREKHRRSWQRSGPFISILHLREIVYFWIFWTFWTFYIDPASPRDCVFLNFLRVVVAPTSLVSVFSGLICILLGRHHPTISASQLFIDELMEDRLVQRFQRTSLCHRRSDVDRRHMIKFHWSETCRPWARVDPGQTLVAGFLRSHWTRFPRP